MELLCSTERLLQIDTRTTGYNIVMKSRTYRLRLVACAAFAGLLTACSAPAPEPPESPIMPRVENTMLDGSVRGDTSDPELARLWAEAEAARLDGQDQDAIDLLLRGLEIDPRNSLLWSRAAEIQLRNDQGALAENYAAKSNEYADGNPALRLRNWLMIQHARRMRGDLLGVRSAEREVQALRYER